MKFVCCFVRKRQGRDIARRSLCLFFSVVLLEDDAKQRDETRTATIGTLKEKLNKLNEEFKSIKNRHWIYDIAHAAIASVRVCCCVAVLSLALFMFHRTFELLRANSENFRFIWFVLGVVNVPLEWRWGKFDYAGFRWQLQMFFWVAIPALTIVLGLWFFRLDYKLCSHLERKLHNMTNELLMLHNKGKKVWRQIQYMEVVEVLEQKVSRDIATVIMDLDEKYSRCVQDPNERGLNICAYQMTFC